MTSRWAALGVAFAVTLIALVVVITTRKDPAPATAPSGSTATGSATPPPRATTAARPQPQPQATRRLSPAEHAKLVAAIAEARTRARAAAGKSTAPTLADDTTITLEDVSGSVKAAFEAAIPILAECYKSGSQAPATKTAAVQMTLWSDPDVGTVIDTDELKDDRGQALPRELDDCLRTSIESLGLPPLDKGGRLPIQYSFRFD